MNVIFSNGKVVLENKAQILDKSDERKLDI